MLKYFLFVAIECDMLTLPYGDFSPKKGKYHNGDVVKFTCANSYVRVGPASTQCYYFGWFPSPPACKGNSSFNFIVVETYENTSVLKISMGTFYKPVLLPRKIIQSSSIKGQKLVLFASFHSVLLFYVKGSEQLNLQC